MFPIRTILHPTDFSEQAAQALTMASALARDYNARLILLHVTPAPPVMTGEMGMWPLPPEEEPGKLWDRLDRVEVVGDFFVERQLGKGNPAEEIVRVAKDNQCDLIVMGTHGRNWLARVLLGSVAEQVLRLAPCPVLTVKTPVPVQPETPAEREVTVVR